MNTNIFGTHGRPLRLLKVVVATALVTTLMACGGGGGASTPITDVSTTPGGLRALSADMTTRKAVNYMPYRSSLTNQARLNEDVTDAEVLQDLSLLLEAGFGLIRIFDSDEKVAQRVLRVVDDNDLDIKVYLGVWMAGNNDAGNKDQMARGVALANSYPDIVVAVSVGNESRVTWSGHRIPAEELVANIKTVRSQISQPVTTDDNWAYYADADRSVIDTIDFAAVHTYAMVDTYYLPKPWDWRQLGETDLTKRAAAMMDAALAATKADYQAARNFLDKRGQTAMPIVIGETGWMNKDPGDGWYRFLAHPVNQKMYLDRLNAWAAEGQTGAGPKNIFYFEAFDEPWKGADDGWGLFNVKREARYAIQSLKTNGAVLAGCTLSTAELTFIDQQNNCKWIWEAGSYTEADALKFVTPTPNAVFTGSQYTLFSEAAGTTVATGLRVDAFSGNSVNAPVINTSAAPGDGGIAIEITPTPRDYGWGLLYSSTTPYGSENLSEFAGASSRLNVWVKTTYPGKIELGLSTDTAAGVVQDAYIQIGNGEYGYKNDGTWSLVSVPIQAFLAVNPKLDLGMVLSRFVIADRYEKTGKPLNSNNRTPITIDGINWSK